MSLATYASEIDFSHNERLGNSNKSKTLKNRRLESSTHQSGKERVNLELKDLKNTVYGEDAETKSSIGNTGMSDFVPYPESIGAARREERDSNLIQNNDKPITGMEQNEIRSGQEQLEGDKACSVEGFDDLVNTQINDYYRRSVPMYQDNTLQSTERDILLAKLNYMIHLLEEQKDERTGHVTEEVILYCFLGIFMIFMVDSFARAGKYVR